MLFSVTLTTVESGPRGVRVISTSISCPSAPQVKETQASFSSLLTLMGNSDSNSGNFHMISFPSSITALPHEIK
jgi:hypothetical protein